MYSLDREVIKLHVSAFYRLYCPKKLSSVDDILIQYAEDPRQLFEDLLRKYPLAPRDYFDDVLSTISGLDSEILSTNRERSDDGTERLHLVSSILARGDEILKRSDHRPDSTDGNGGFSRSQNTDELELIQSNAQLAKAVTLVELQVLQKRFEVLFLEKVLIPQEEQKPTSKTFRMIIDDSTRRLSVACNQNTRLFICEGPLRAALPIEDEDNCRVSFTEDDVEPVLWSRCAKVVLAAAMRVWSRGLEHAVQVQRAESNLDTNRVDTVQRSSIVWWQWPSLCKSTEGMTPEPLVGNFASDFVTQDPSSLTQQFATGRDESTFFDYFVNRYDQLRV